MIGNTTRGGNFDGCIRYIFGGGRKNVHDRAVLLGGSMAGNDAKSLIREFREVRGLRPDCKNPVKHISYSLPVGEHLDRSEWLEVGQATAEEYGYDSWCMVHHSDKAHEDVHFVGSRITQDGRVIREPAFDVQIPERVARRFEKNFGLFAVKSPERSASGKKIPTEQDGVKAATWREQQMMRRSGEMSIRVEMQVLVGRALKAKPTTWEELREELQKHQITLTTKGQKQITGVTYERNGESMTGSDLGKNYSAKGIQKQLNENQENSHATARTSIRVRGPRAIATPEDVPSVRLARNAHHPRRCLLDNRPTEDVEPRRGPEPGAPGNLACAGDNPGWDSGPQYLGGAGAPVAGHPRQLGSGTLEAHTRSSLESLDSARGLSAGCSGPGQPGSAGVQGGANAAGTGQLGPCCPEEDGDPRDDGQLNLGAASIEGSGQADAGVLDRHEMAAHGPESPVDCGVLGPGWGPDARGPWDSGGAVEGLEESGSGALSGAASEPHPEQLNSAGFAPVAGFNPPPGSSSHQPCLARLNGNPELPHQVHPEELPALVQKLGSGSRAREIGAEVEVREGYGLPQVSSSELTGRSWLTRARDLVRDGWAKVRGLFSRAQATPPDAAKKPEEQACEPKVDYDPFELLGQVVVENELTRMHAKMSAREKAHQEAMDREALMVRQVSGERPLSLGGRLIGR